MRRYALDLAPKGELEVDVLIVGSGIAGLYTAMHIDKRLRCAIITKESVDISNSWLAQGGIAAAISREDTPQLHLEDTLVAGAGLCDREAVRVLVDEGPGDIRTLLGWNVPFDLNAYGDLSITREGGHTRNRIVHAGGDATGRETVKVLAAHVSLRDNVRFIQNAFFSDILTNGDNCVGAVIIDGEGGVWYVRAPHICICTGGIGQIYTHSTNPNVATGDGIAAALRAGASHKNLEFIQFHPTALYSEEGGRSFLISEALRGEGAVLRNINGERFMKGAHPMDELAPRDIVARAIVREMERTGERFVYLDITCHDADFLSKRFPTIFSECESRGIDISKDFIPVCPVQHYLIGGIRTDLNGETCVRGLYACGEAAYTGVHGANRLASNSMLECLVFGRRSAMHINNSGMGAPSLDWSAPPLADAPGGDIDDSELRLEIRRIMDTRCGVVRTLAGLKTGISEMGSVIETLEASSLRSKTSLECYNMALVSRAILSSAAERTESVGAHFLES